MNPRLPFLLAALGLCLGCGSSVSSDEQARRAYLGLDASIEKAIQLGFDGFNSASSANISPQTAKGTTAGTLVVSGQVDQGASANKGMRLSTAYTAYSDDGKLVYDTAPAALPALTMQLKSIPSGTLDGTLVGTVNMTGELAGPVMLNVTLSATIEPVTTGTTTPIRRKAGTTHITGTASSGGGTYQIDITK
jgi:hypothetical protein